MMTSAALLGIDSCPMERFDLDKVTEILAEENVVDTEHSHHQLWLHLVIERRTKDKVRQPAEDVIEWI